MRALLTGASSFTGAWFARALAAEGFEVVAALRGPDTREGPRGARLAAARGGGALLVPEAPFGSARFLALVRDEGPFDILCHHGAEVGDFRRVDYDPDAAVTANTRGLEAVLDALEASGCGALLATGSVFEADEGLGCRPLRAFNAYGLAKTLTWHRLRFAAERRGWRLGKAVVPSPFGPLEKEDGTAAGMMRAWARGGAAVLRRPGLVRDHVPAAFLARAYAGLARDLLAAADGAGPEDARRAAPSAFAEPLLDFAERLARAMRPRLGLACAVLVAEQTDAAFGGGEPLVRRNPDPVPELADRVALEAMWDEYAAHARSPDSRQQRPVAPTTLIN